VASASWFATTIAKRWCDPRQVAYAAQTAPLVAYYAKGAPARVDGVGAVDEVTSAIFRAIGAV
jgi:adenylate kinase family enzyme